MSIFNKGAEAIGNAAEKIGGALDKNITSKDEILTHQNESLERNAKDRMDARDMYKSDSSLQKVYALAFLAFYMGLVGLMVFYIFTLTRGEDIVDLPEWAIAFLSTIFGAMSTKVGTITDFLFGGSKTAEIQERRKRR